MLYTYKTYQNNIKTLSLAQMQKIHESILSDIHNDEEAIELYEDFVKQAIKYAQIRANWNNLSREQKLEQDSSRTSCHDVTIISLNVLTRWLKKQNKTCKWRDELGYEEEDKYCRKTIGDFACYVSFIQAINSR